MAAVVGDDIAWRLSACHRARRNTLPARMQHASLPDFLPSHDHAVDAANCSVQVTSTCPLHSISTNGKQFICCAKLPTPFDVGTKDVTLGAQNRCPPVSAEIPCSARCNCVDCLLSFMRPSQPHHTPFKMHVRTLWGLPVMCVGMLVFATTCECLQ